MKNALYYALSSSSDPNAPPRIFDTSIFNLAIFFFWTTKYPLVFAAAISSYSRPWDASYNFTLLAITSFSSLVDFVTEDLLGLCVLGAWDEQPNGFIFSWLDLDLPPLSNTLLDNVAFSFILTSILFLCLAIYISLFASDSPLLDGWPVTL